MKISIKVIQENRDAYKVEIMKELDAEFLTNGCHFERQALDSNTVLNLQRDKTKLQLLCENNNLFVNLKLLNISYCGLTEIPGAVLNLKYLIELNLSNNCLESLPKELGNLCNLTVLKLSTNKLSSLPKSLKNAQQLNYLDLSSNEFDEVPDVLFYSLRVLQVLDLSCNKIKNFSDPPACLYKLIVLGLSDNVLNYLPMWIFDNFCQLKYLDVSKNPLQLQNQAFSYFKGGVFETLKFLNIENCKLSFQTIQILFFFKNLKVLYLGNKSIAGGQGKQNNYMGNIKMYLFKEIKHLYVQNVQIAILPADLNSLKNIQVLDLSDNLLSWVPECLCDLTSLEILNLTSNQLLFLPANIGNLVNLKQILVGNNKLCCIPDSFYTLCNLEYVDFYNNSIEKIDPVIFEGKNLKGIDLELNCLCSIFCGNGVDVTKIQMVYVCLKEFFRKHFNYVEARCDSQKTKLDENLDEISSDSNSRSIKLSLSSFESEQLSDSEEMFLVGAQHIHPEDEDWEKKNSCEGGDDELFDPNDEKTFPLSRTSWEVNFGNNFCPAVYHTSPVLRNYVRKFNLALKDESIEEGQFDSD